MRQRSPAPCVLVKELIELLVAASGHVSATVFRLLHRREDVGPAARSDDAFDRLAVRAEYSLAFGICDFAPLWQLITTTPRNCIRGVGKND